MPKTLISLALALLLGLPSASIADTQQPSGTKDQNIGRWSLGCAPRGCFIFLNDAYAGNNTVEVGIDRKTKKAVLFGFVTEGDADQNKGVTVTFAKTVTDAQRPECGGGPDVAKPVDCYDIKIDPNSTFTVPFADCDASTCVARVQGQSVKGAQTGKPVDLLEYFLGSNHALYQYTDRKGDARRRMLDLDGFAEVYQAAMKDVQHTP